MFVGDSFGNGETEAGAFESLGGVEWFEDPGESVLGDSWAVIDDGDDDGGAEDVAEVFFVGAGFDEGDLDGDGSCFGFDAFDGVGDQVHQDLMDE